MYCKRCGRQIADDSVSCSNCGTMQNEPLRKNAPNPAEIVRKKKKPIFSRWWFWVIIVVIVLITIGGGGEDHNSDSNSSDGITSAAQDSKDKDDAATPQIKGFSNIEYANKSPVEFTNAEHYTDSDGDSFFVIYYTWTNNTDETVSPYLKIIAKAFQNGKELESCYYSVRDFDTDKSTSEARPGITLNLHDLWYINDDAPVEIEIQEFWSDDIIASATVDPAALK